MGRGPKCQGGSLFLTSTTSTWSDLLQDGLLGFGAQGAWAGLTYARSKATLPSDATTASDTTASRGHMLLYIPIDITALWNVRKCVVLASASSEPAAWPREHACGFFLPQSHFLPAAALLTSNPPHCLPPLQTSPSVLGFRPPTVASLPSPSAPAFLTLLLTVNLWGETPSPGISQRITSLPPAPSSAQVAPEMGVSTKQAEWQV